MDTPLLRVGCPAWAHKPWQGRFLPAGLGRNGVLAAYATWCTAVEGNTTFYAVPPPATIAAWAAATPPLFRFAFKFPKIVSHDAPLTEGVGAARAFVELLAPLGPRADPVTLQLPASFGPGALGRLARFLDALPPERRYAVEVRHPGFHDRSPADRALDRLLDERGTERVVFDTTTLFAAPPVTDAERGAWGAKPRLPVRHEARTDRPVVRFLGRDDAETTAAGWQPWLPVVAGWLAEGRSPTFFVHTPDDVEALPLARRFHDEVRALVPELTPLPEPRTRDALDEPPATLF